MAKKDFNLPKHSDIDVPNLQVIKSMQSLESRGFVKTRFSWQYYYYYLNDTGVEYLRQYLHLPVEVVPHTHIKSNKTGLRPGTEQRERPQRGEGGGYRSRGEGEGYRRRDRDGEKEGAAGDFKPEFVEYFGFGS